MGVSFKITGVFYCNEIFMPSEDLKTEWADQRSHFKYPFQEMIFSELLCKIS